MSDLQLHDGHISSFPRHGALGRSPESHEAKPGDNFSPPQVSLPGGLKNVPICEDCDSKFGIGFVGRGAKASNPEQAKDFRRKSISSENPKIGRNALIF
jgi:hypothetical protein